MTSLASYLRWRRVHSADDLAEWAQARTDCTETIVLHKGVTRVLKPVRLADQPELRLLLDDVDFSELTAQD